MTLTKRENAERREQGYYSVELELVILLTQANGRTAQHRHNWQRNFQTGDGMSRTWFAITASCQQIQQQPEQRDN